jgi:hypothetical protein
MSTRIKRPHKAEAEKVTTEIKRSQQPPLMPLLYTRKQTCELLNCSWPMVRELEANGKLTPIQLGHGAANSTIRYRRTEIEKIIGEAIDASN